MRPGKSRWSAGCSGERLGVASFRRSCVPKRKSCPFRGPHVSSDMTGMVKGGGGMHACTEAYHIVDTDPEGEETVRAVPLGAGRFRGEDIMELAHLIDDGPVSKWPAGEMRAQLPGRVRMARKVTYKTVGRYGATSAESMVAPPEARLNTCCGGSRASAFAR